MTIDIDKTAATRLLHASYLACTEKPVEECPISSAINLVMDGRNCLTYRYIMFTALLAKAVDPAIDVLSLQAGDRSAGAYDAQSLASKVDYPRFRNPVSGWSEQWSRDTDDVMSGRSGSDVYDASFFHNRSTSVSRCSHGEFGS